MCGYICMWLFWWYYSIHGVLHSHFSKQRKRKIYACGICSIENQFFLVISFSGYFINNNFFMFFLHHSIYFLTNWWRIMKEISMFMICFLFLTVGILKTIKLMIFLIGALQLGENQDKWVCSYVLFSWIFLPNSVNYYHIFV